MKTAANAHIHLPPNFSAFDTVSQAVSLAGKEGLRLLGASNYYDYSVYKPFAEECRRAKLFALFGLEIIALLDDLQDKGIRINDPGNPGKLYLCGKGIHRVNPMNEVAGGLLQTIRINDTSRCRKIVDRMRLVMADHGCTVNLTEEMIIEGVAKRHLAPIHSITLQERHIAQAFQEAMFEEDSAEAILSGLGVPREPVPVQNALRSTYMKAGKQAYVQETFVGFDHAFRLILELGGIPSYPVLADGAKPICEFEQDVDQLIDSLRDWNIHAAEFIPVRNAPETLMRYVPAMRQAGLVVTAGTEHNTLDLIPLNPSCAGGAAIPEEVEAIFWEGTCVAAGHQTAAGRGEQGFVDCKGNPSPGFSSQEDRISHFRRIGEAAIESCSQGKPND